MRGLLINCILSYGEEYNYSSVQTHTDILHNRLGIRLHACASSVLLENTNQALCFSCLSVNWNFSLSFKQLDDRAVDVVMTKLFNNYRKWCKFLSRKHSLRCIPYNCYQRKKITLTVNGTDDLATADFLKAHNHRKFSSGRFYT